MSSSGCPKSCDDRQVALVITAMLSAAVLASACRSGGEPPADGAPSAGLAGDPAGTPAAAAPLAATATEPVTRTAMASVAPTLTAVPPSPTTPPSPTATAAAAAVAAPELPDLGPAPEFFTDVWLNTDRPLALGDLRGRVVLVEFWTFG
jgi:hypothetical protein